MPTSPKGAEESYEAYSPDKLGEYTVIKDIAEGTFGKVKMARHIVTGQIVAMKYIPKATIQATRTKTRVQREVLYMRKLRHPHIVKLYEVITTATDIIIVLEYAGGELFDYIVAHGKMGEDEARKFFQQVISGVQYSHSLNIIHRDLKPENVLLDEDNNVKIADFGLSNEMHDGTFLGTSCGSPNYAAPEVIKGDRYAGPEIDVWSCGVILYVMLCGRLPFEDENVQALFKKIGEGEYYQPPWLSAEAKNLIAEMLILDPFKRITIQQITEHPFYKKNLPRYLTPLPPAPPVMGTLQSLVQPKALPFEMIAGLGRVETAIVDELVCKMEGVTSEDIWDWLRRPDGIQGNAVKVAYMLLRDKHRGSRNLLEFEEEQRDAHLALIDPSAGLSPNVAPGSGGDVEGNPFEAEFNDEYGLAEGDEDDDGELDFSTPPFVDMGDGAEVNNFAVLNSSLPPPAPSSDAQSSSQQQHQHHLASYAAAKRDTRSSGAPREKRIKNARFHFGIRSRSAPMEVMVEVYRSLRVLGMEWKEKRNLGGLGGVRSRQVLSADAGKTKRERVTTIDGTAPVDMKAAAGIYFVETRTRVGNVVVLMDLQLYMLDATTYVVDFHHKKSYKASEDPDAGKYDMAVPADIPDNTLEDGSHIKAWDMPIKKEDVVSPFVFMDVARRLILELAQPSQSE